MGGDLLDGRRTRFDSPEAVAVFELLETLVREDLIYQNSPRTFDDQNAFARDAIAFNLRTSSSIPYVARLMEDDAAWGVAPIPQADPAHPDTARETPPTWRGGGLNPRRVCARRYPDEYLFRTGRKNVFVSVHQECIAFVL